MDRPQLDDNMKQLIPFWQIQKQLQDSLQESMTVMQNWQQIYDPVKDLLKEKGLCDDVDVLAMQALFFQLLSVKEMIRNCYANDLNVFNEAQTDVEDDDDNDGNNTRKRLQRDGNDEFVNDAEFDQQYNIARQFDQENQEDDADDAANQDYDDEDYQDYQDFDDNDEENNDPKRQRLFF